MKISLNKILKIKILRGGNEIYEKVCNAVVLANAANTTVKNLYK